MTLLAVENLTVRYGSAVAVSEVSMTVPEGALVGLIGPNGAGKTSLLDALTGFTPVAAGRVLLRGQDVTTLAPHRRSRHGMARTWQAVELFDELTVAQNVALGAREIRWWTGLLDIFWPRAGTIPAAAAEALEAMCVDAFADALPTEISTGTRSLVGVARALAAKPRLLVLDEPAAGLSSKETERLGQGLREIAENGTSMLLVDHDMRLQMSVCDEIHVLDFGAVIAHGSPEEVRNAPAVIDAYLGTPIDSGGA